MTDRDFLEQDKRLAAMANSDKRDDEARRRVRALEITARAGRGERISVEEFKDVAWQNGHDDLADIFDAIKAETSPANALRMAMSKVMVIIAVHRVGQFEKRLALEDRIACLEAKLAERDAAPDKRILAGKLRVVGGKGK